MAPAEVRMSCAKGSSLEGGWSWPWGENAFHGQKREDIELDRPGTHVFSSAVKLPSPWWHLVENLRVWGSWERDLSPVRGFCPASELSLINGPNFTFGSSEEALCRRGESLLSLHQCPNMGEHYGVCGKTISGNKVGNPRPASRDGEHRRGRSRWSLRVML